MISPTTLLAIGFVLQCIVTVKTVKSLITPKLTEVEEPPRFTVRQFFIEKDKVWVWSVYDNKCNDFARSNGYFKTFQQETDAKQLAKIYERTGGPVQ